MGWQRAGFVAADRVQTPADGPVEAVEVGSLSNTTMARAVQGAVPGAAGALVAELAAYGGNLAVGGYMQQASATGPAALPPGRYTVVVVGSPSPHELPGHAFQFADAAAQVTGASRVWLVERTGYELGKVDLGGIAARAKGAPVFWITPATPLATLLGQFPKSSIAVLRVYSHGVTRMLTLRYGWNEAENYGLSLADARSLTPQAFTADADISFDSCNTATDPTLLQGLPHDERSLAAAVADATEKPVTAWVGRTSYRYVNKGTGGVVGSEVFGDGWRPDLKEVYSSAIGRTPRQEVTAPTRSAGDWSSRFSMRARLPQTRHFDVPDGGSVSVTIAASAASSEYLPMQDQHIRVILHRVAWGPDEDLPGTVDAVGGATTVLDWSKLRGGTYYLELFHLSGLEVRGTIDVKIR